VYVKRHVRRKDGKAHVYYSLCESVRVSGNRVIQRRVLNLGELEHDAARAVAALD
jgi:hypothetical protein